MSMRPNHRWEDTDVEDALARYRRLTGDTAAKMRREVRGSVVAYRVEDSQTLRGFLAYGAFSAMTAIEMYCNGWEDKGRAVDSAKKKPR